jgi:LysM repeat protein
MSTSKKLVTLLLSVLLLVGLPVSHTQATATDAKLLPEVQSLEVGQLTTVTLRVENVQNLYGYQVTITFNPALLEVIDADPGEAGVQVGLGTFVTPDYVPQNAANNAAGTIDCVVSQVAPSTAANGSGALLTISFRGKAAGVSAIQLNPLVLASAQGTEIAANIHNAQISVGSPTPTSTATVPTATHTPTSTATSTPTGTVVPPTSTPTATSTPTGTVVPPTSTPTPTPTATLPPGPTITYVVRTGDTLYSIAYRFCVSVRDLMVANGITNPNYIRVGQVLTIPNPCSTPPPTRTPPAPRPTRTIYVVQPGDTLYSIARRFGTTVWAIARANHIVNPHLIYVGQRLVIRGGSPTTPPCMRRHIVRYGETLTSIARRYGTTVWRLARINNLANPNVIYAGQRLIVPC